MTWFDAKDMIFATARSQEFAKRGVSKAENSIKQQRWSPRGRAWPRGHPRGHILKSLALASKPQVLENCPVLGSGVRRILKRGDQEVQKI